MVAMRLYRYLGLAAQRWSRRDGPGVGCLCKTFGLELNADMSKFFARCLELRAALAGADGPPVANDFRDLGADQSAVSLAAAPLRS